MSKVFTMPDVQLGSILAYRYKLEHWPYPPQWVIQKSIPVLKAHYNFRPGSGVQIFYTARLPEGDGVFGNKNGSYDLTIEHVPALPDEEYLPPIRRSVLSREFFLFIG